MKKIVKGFLFLVCLGVIVFLLLPFLETENNTASGSALQTTAEPQIFTSNPLTTLVQRLASLFRKNNAKENPTPVQTTAALTKEEAEERFGVPQYKTRGAGDGDMSEQEVLSAAPGGTITTSASGETMYLNEDGEWVLIRQISHETSTPGMHEINIKDNAYDAYVRQQQAADLNPALQTGQTAPKEDSYWQKLIRPVKKLFRTSDAKPVANKGLQTDSEDANAFMLASADGLTKNRTNAGGKYQNTMPDFAMQGADFSQQALDKKEQQDIEQLAALLDPTALAEQAAELMAEIEVPERKTPEQEQQYQESKQKHREQFRQEIKAQILEHMSQLQQNTPDKDNLKAITQNACRNDSLPANGMDCADRQATDPATKQATMAQNSQFFTTKTHLAQVPNFPVLPIAGVVKDPLQFEQIPPEVAKEGQLPPEVMTSREILAFMSEQKNCQNDTCFAIANDIQKDPSLKDSIEMAGGIFVGDKTNYQAFEQPFVQKRLLELPPDATSEQRAQAEAQARKEFKESAPAYVFVNKQELAAIQQKLTDIVSKKSISPDVAFLYVMNGHDALTVANDIDSTFFLFSRGSLQDNAVAQSQMTTGDVAENIVQIGQISKQITGKTTPAFVKDKINKDLIQVNQIIKNSHGDSSLAASQLTDLMQQKAQQSHEKK